jgi:hypothetical protein
MNAPEPQPVAMNPTLVTAPELADIQAELLRLEPIFHWPPSQMTQEHLESMTTDGFWEVGASGNRYSRAFCLKVLEERRKSPESAVWKITDAWCRKLADDVFLLTYTLLQDNARLTQRATIWQKTQDGWKIVYHQGTVVAEA